MNDDDLLCAMFAQPVVELAVNHDERGKSLHNILDFIASPIQFPKPRIDFGAPPPCTDYEKMLTL